MIFVVNAVNGRQSYLKSTLLRFSISVKILNQVIGVVVSSKRTSQGTKYLCVRISTRLKLQRYYLSASSLIIFTNALMFFSKIQMETVRMLLTTQPGSSRNVSKNEISVLPLSSCSQVTDYSLIKPVGLKSTSLFNVQNERQMSTALWGLVRSFAQSCNA